MASGGRAPRSRITRAAASRCSAGSTASRYVRPPRSGVAVEARKTVRAFTSGWEAIVGCIGTKTARNAHSLVGSRESGNAVLALIGNAHDAGPSSASPSDRTGHGLLLQKHLLQCHGV